MNKCLNCGKDVKAKYCNVSCQNIHQNSAKADKKWGELKLFDVECGKCKISFQVKEREKLFPKKETYYCTRACANTRIHSDETRKKLKIILNKYKPAKKESFKINCLYCNNEFLTKKLTQQFCSVSCAKKYHMSQGDIASRMGKQSVLNQKEIKRSKNEIYFGELCKTKFNSVKFNEPLFNGWDADIIIEDFKLAILWNGKWHYEKITEKHSVEQVQNRDKIKLEEILEKDYKCYIIKDMGKCNKKFVEEKFQEMLDYLKLI